MRHWNYLVAVQRNRLNYSAKAHGFTVTAGGSGEAAWAGRLLISKKSKRMVSQKSHSVQITEVGNPCYSSETGVHQGHVFISSNSSILGIHDVVVTTFS